MNEKQELPKIILRYTELHRIGDITLTYVKGNEPIIQVMLDGTTSTELSLDQAMELSVILKIWTKEYGKPKKKGKNDDTQVTL